MAKLRCKCGQILSNSLYPNDIQHWVYSDKNIDKICKKNTIKVKKLIGKEDYEVWVCPECKRLIVFKNGKNKAKYIYQIEE